MAVFLRRALPALCLLLAAVASWGQAVTKEQKDEVLKELQTIMVERAFVPGIDFKLWPEHLEKQREDIAKAADQSAFVTSVNRALRSFGVSHISLRTPRARESRRTTTTIGVGLSASKTDDGLVVRMLFPKSPAEEAGIKEGETIVEVDGKAPDSPAVLNGAEGTEITVKVKGRDGAIREVKLSRKRFSTVRPEMLTWSGEDAAVLKIYTFSSGYSRENVEKLVAEAVTKAKYLVIDLRNNGGGAVANLRHLLSMLLPQDTVIGTFVSRRTARQYAEDKKVETTDVVELAKSSTEKFKAGTVKDIRFTGRIAVLINGRSGSASEIAAAALRENMKAPLVGSRSAGAVLASVFARLPNDFECQYPVQDYVTAQGIRLEKNPLKPDAEVELSSAEGADPAVVKALELLKKG